MSTPSLTLQLFCPFWLRSFQPVVSLPLKSGRKPESAALAASASERNSRAVFISWLSWQQQRDSEVWLEGQRRRTRGQGPSEWRQARVFDNVGFPKRLHGDRERCKKLFRGRIPCTRRLGNDPASFCCWDVCRGPTVHDFSRPRYSFASNRLLPVPRSRTRRDVLWPDASCPARDIQSPLARCDS